MSDNYTRQSDTFRAKDKGGIKSPVLIAGAHTRTYKMPAQSLVATGASAVNLTVPSGADFAEITMEGAAATDFVRYWHGSTDPTSTVGVKLMDGDTIVSADPATFTAIKGSTGSGGTLRCEFFSYE